jgi:tetratricopeptide (TPR) repeat protein
MRYFKHAVAASFLLFVLFPTQLTRAVQSFMINPEKPPQVITVQAGTDFSLTLQGKGWYLDRYDRSLLSFKLRRIDPDSTSFIMHGVERGTAQLVISMKQIDIPLIVVIADGAEEHGAEVPTKKDEQNTGMGSSDAELPPSVSERVEALRERGQVDEQGTGAQMGEGEPQAAPVVQENGQPETMEEVASSEEEVPGKEQVQTEKPERTAASTQKRVEHESQENSGDDSLYYIDEKDRIVMVPRVREEDIYRRGRRLYQRGEYDGALQELQRYMENCETCTRIDSTRMMLAEIALHRDDIAAALFYLGAVVESGAEKAVLVALKTRAPLFLESEQYEHALSDYEELYRREGGDPALVLILGDINYTLDRKGEALRWYEAGVSEGVATDETIFRVATLYDSPGVDRDIEKAFAYYLLITEQYRSSEYYEPARKRVQFLESNFFDYH